MVLILKKGSGKKDLRAILDKLPKQKGFDAQKHLGVLNLKEQPLHIQKKLRDEWQ